MAVRPDSQLDPPSHGKMGNALGLVLTTLTGRESNPLVGNVRPCIRLDLETLKRYEIGGKTYGVSLKPA
jgi:hypothetical protein